MARAYGALKVDDVVLAREHLAVLAESDPELFVRDAASMALSLPPRSVDPEPSLRPPFKAGSLIDVAVEMELMGAPDPIQLAGALHAAVADAERSVQNVLVAIFIRIVIARGERVGGGVAPPRTPPISAPLLAVVDHVKLLCLSW